MCTTPDSLPLAGWHSKSLQRKPPGTTKTPTNEVSRSVEHSRSVEDLTSLTQLPKMNANVEANPYIKSKLTAYVSTPVLPSSRLLSTLQT